MAQQQSLAVSREASQGFLINHVEFVTVTFWYSKPYILPPAFTQGELSIVPTMHLYNHAAQQMGIDFFPGSVMISSYPEAQDLIILIIIYRAINVVSSHESMNEIA